MRSLRLVLPNLCLLVLGEIAQANMCGLPHMNVASAGTLSGGAGTAVISAGLTAGTAASTSAVLSVGLQAASAGAFACFLSTETPQAVFALPGTRSVQRLVQSPSATMTLEWTDGSGMLPVTYQVLVGTSPSALAQAAAGLRIKSYVLSNLAFSTPYYWRIAAADQFDRTSLSDIYSFSIAPAVAQLYLAPNPFHPRHGPASILLTLNGAGSAEVEIYSLPGLRRVLSRRYDGLQDGANELSYDGRDDSGQYLRNGIYLIRVQENGAHAKRIESFKAIIAH